MFEGAGCYYEDCRDSQRQYIAWSGDLPGDSRDSRDAAMRLLLDLGRSMGRVIILPRVRNKSVTYGEKAFRVTDLDLDFTLRESNFLFHPFLGGGQQRRAMYPVSQVIVRARGSPASLHRVDADLSSNTQHFKLPEGAAGEDVAFVLSGRREVRSSKLLLVSVDLLEAGSCGGAGSMLETCEISDLGPMGATDVC